MTLLSKNYHFDHSSVYTGYIDSHVDSQDICPNEGEDPFIDLYLSKRLMSS